MLVVVLLVFAAYSAQWTGFRGQTLWDWLGLLIVPVVVAAGVAWFNRRQQERDQQIAQQRTQDEALQAYLSQVGLLMIQHDLRNSEWYSDTRILARALTLTILPRLSDSRKSQCFQFLMEANLIQWSQENESPAINLHHADLSGANLTRITLNSAVLNSVDLRNADLSFAQLGRKRRLGRWTITDYNPAQLNAARLSNATLANASFDGVELVDADLSGANLRDADLSDADLSGANLRDTKGWTMQQLTSAKSLEGATMPNGQKYEEWIKDRENLDNSDS